MYAIPKCVTIFLLFGTHTHTHICNQGTTIINEIKLAMRLWIYMYMNVSVLFRFWNGSSYHIGWYNISSSKFKFRESLLALHPFAYTRQKKVIKKNKSGKNVKKKKHEP